MWASKSPTTMAEPAGSVLKPNTSMTRTSSAATSRLISVCSSFWRSVSSPRSSTRAPVSISSVMLPTSTFSSRSSKPKTSTSPSTRDSSSCCNLMAS
ncbi:hypothetical protein YPPY06_4871 [Yersinia pestis PY-06]|nr:hypothetical protein YPPY06_4871 [Yersinia pestis PY-06]EIS11599.1 hypothetical protein YPPY52_4880 [Yersinia pestis PY-52]